MGTRSEALAKRLEQGAAQLAAFAETLTDAEWNQSIPKDGRTAAAIVHHVASGYVGEMELIKRVAEGKPVEGITWDDIHRMNGEHGREHAHAPRNQTLDLLRKNSAKAASLVRSLSDEQLDRAAPISLSYGAPLTSQYLIENHSLRHSYHHLGVMRQAFGRGE